LLSCPWLGGTAQYSAGRPIPTNATHRSRQLIDWYECSHTDGLDDKLSDPVATGNAHRMGAVSVDQTNLDLTAVAGVYGAWGVNDTDAVLRSQPGARVYESRVAGRQRDGNASPHQATFAGLELETFSAAQIGARIAWVCVRRRLQLRIELEQQHIDGGHDSLTRSA
jgi:hypothetical protein